MGPIKFIEFVADDGFPVTQGHDGTDYKVGNEFHVDDRQGGVWIFDILRIADSVGGRRTVYLGNRRRPKK